MRASPLRPVGLRGRARVEPPRAWMIGNSPKSDINPALECGLNAVFVPHERTWSLERQEIRPGSGRLIVVERFADDVSPLRRAR